MNKTVPGEFASIQNIIEHLERGDLIEFELAWVAKHWAVYIGLDDSQSHTIIHLSTDDDGLIVGHLSRQINVSSSAPFSSIGGGGGVPKIVKSDLLSFAQSRKCRINNSDDNDNDPLNMSMIVQRAEDRVGILPDYDLFSNNCEHFARWCRYDRAVSQQAISAKGVLACVAYVAYFGLEVAGVVFSSNTTVRLLKNVSQVVATSARDWYQQDGKEAVSGQRKHKKNCRCRDCLYKVEEKRQSESLDCCQECSRQKHSGRDGRAETAGLQ